MPIAISGYSHVRLTVTDIGRSREFYDRVFGFPVAWELPAGADQATQEVFWFLFGGVLYKVPGGYLGLRPVAPSADAFDEDRVGLDHVSFACSLEQIAEAAGTLDELGIPHGGVKDVGPALLLEFRDPDGIALELYADK